jgi:superfamily II DNA/RNA helicase
VLILAPTRELVVQIAHEAEKILDTPDSQIDAVAVYGGGDRYTQQKAVEKGCDIIAATPGRLHDFVESGILTISGVGYFVLDEADCMLDHLWGFGEDVASIVEQVKPDRRMFFFGATWNNEVQKIAQGLCQSKAKPVRISYAQEDRAENGRALSTGKAREGITQEVVVVDLKGANAEFQDSWEKWEKHDAYKYEIMSRHVTKVLQESESTKVLVFVGMKRLADRLSTQLYEQGFQAGAIHGGKPQHQRLWVLQQFRAGELRLLVSTDVLCRGIDIPDLTHVVIHEMGEIEEYIHRIGRTARGRDAKGHALVFFEYEQRDSKCAASLVQVLEASKQHVPKDLRRIAAEVENGQRTVRAAWKPSDFGITVADNRSLFRRRLHAVIAWIQLLFAWLRRRVGG